MKKFILSLCIIFCFINSIHAQLFFPLKVGNKFVYFVESYSYPSHIYSISKMIVLKDSILNNKKYFLFNSFPYVGTNIWLRVDSITGSLLMYDTSNSCQFYFKEKLIDSLKLDTTNCYENSCSYWYIETKGIDTIYNQQTTYKIFVCPPNEMERKRKYNSLFGLTKFRFHYSGVGNSYTSEGNLKGCEINGVMYGDTSTTIIYSISGKIPDKFQLHQNYPNPFNPTTIIKYQIKELSSPHALSGDLVTLKIYDILGKEVTTLVNEKQSPGTYEVSWDGSSYPSGVYFYKLMAGDFTETKKMLMIK